MTINTQNCTFSSVYANLFCDFFALRVLFLPKSVSFA